MKSYLLKFLIFSIIFILTIGIVIIRQTSQIQNLSIQPFIPQNSNFKQQPPPIAITGIISEPTGKVEKDARNIVELIPLSATSSGELLSIISGEGLVTGEESSVHITFPGFGTISMASNSQAAFDNPFADRFLVRQQRGNISYALNNPTKELSVRSLHFLFTFSGEKTDIKVDETKKTAVISLPTGQAKIGMLDLENNTKTWDITGPTIITINDKKRIIIEEKIEPSN